MIVQLRLRDKTEFSVFVNWLDAQILIVVNEINSEPTRDGIYDLLNNGRNESIKIKRSVFEYRWRRLMHMRMIEAVYSNHGMNNPMWYLLTERGHAYLEKLQRGEVPAF